MHLELAVPVWNSGLTLKLATDIERVQRVAVSILLENSHYEYLHACTMLGLKPLYIRREELCKRFAIKTAKPVSRHSDLFQLEKTGYHDTRSGNRYREHVTTKGRFYKSPLPYLTRLLNED